MLTLTLCILPLWTEDALPTPTADMKPISFLVGSWSGTGWAFTREGKQEFTIRESIIPKLDGSVFFVEGIGKDSKGHVAHHALAFFHYDKASKEYRVKAFRKDGGYVDAKGVMKDGAFVWGFDQPQGKVRFTLKLNEKGQWFESGEFSQDGKTWRLFLEMTLDKAK